jgi:hypothetical protein
LKENARMSRLNTQNNETLKIAKPSTEKRSEGNLASNCLSKIKDLAYMEVGGKHHTEARANSREKKSA